MRASPEARDALLRFYEAFTEAIRLTAVMLKEDGGWTIQHGHFSVGVPDEVAFENAAEWSTSAPSH